MFDPAFVNNVPSEQGEHALLTLVRPPQELIRPDDAEQQGSVADIHGNTFMVIFIKVFFLGARKIRYEMEDGALDAKHSKAFWTREVS